MLSSPSIDALYEAVIGSYTQRLKYAEYTVMDYMHKSWHMEQDVDDAYWAMKGRWHEALQREGFPKGIDMRLYDDKLEMDLKKQLRCFKIWVYDY